MSEGGKEGGRESGGVRNHCIITSSLDIGKGNVCNKMIDYFPVLQPG